MKLLTKMFGRDRASVAPVQEARQEPMPLKAKAQYLRDTKSGMVSARRVGLTDSRHDIRQSWGHAAALALDVIKNSGQLKGATDQVIADTVGSELHLNPRPDLSSLGYSDKERTDWIREVRSHWKRYAWNPAECDFRGKFTVPQMVDVALRWFIAYGEVTGLIEFMPEHERRKYGIQTGTKLCLTPPTRLVQDTHEIEGLFQGVYHDENGRPVGYQFEEREAGFARRVTHPAFDAAGRQVVLHVFDPMDATDVRGISVLAPAIRTHLQRETLMDVTLQMSILQTMMALVLTSEKPSMEAFEAIEQLKGANSKSAEQFAEAFSGYMQASLDRAASEGNIEFGRDPNIAHLGPGEDLAVKTADVPGGQFLPFQSTLARDMARAIGISYGGLTMDHENASYSSVRMEVSSIWPVVTRRRERIAAPICQALYEAWLDEMIGTGKIEFKGGYQAFLANKDKVTWAQWQGPAKPTADDYKSARASSERIENRTSSRVVESADLGLDSDELFEQQLEDHKRYLEAGMESPYARRTTSRPALEEDDERKLEQGLR